MKKLFSISKIIGMTAFIIAVVLKSLYLLNILIETPIGANPMLVIGVMLLATTYLFASFGKIKDIFYFIFNQLFGIFLISSLFFFMHWPGGVIMLLLMLGLIPILLLFLIMTRKSDNESTITREDLLWVIAILFVMLFFQVTWILHFSKLIPIQH